MSSISFLNASRFLGWSLSSWATQSRSWLLCTPRSVPFGCLCDAAMSRQEVGGWSPSERTIPEAWYLTSDLRERQTSD